MRHTAHNYCEMTELERWENEGGMVLPDERCLHMDAQPAPSDTIDTIGTRLARSKPSATIHQTSLNQETNS